MTTKLGPPASFHSWMSWEGMEEFFTPMTRGFFRMVRSRDMVRATPASWGIRRKAPDKLP